MVHMIQLQRITLKKNWDGFAFLLTHNLCKYLNIFKWLNEPFAPVKKIYVPCIRLAQLASKDTREVEEKK